MGSFCSKSTASNAEAERIPLNAEPKKSYQETNEKLALAFLEKAKTHKLIHEKNEFGEIICTHWDDEPDHNLLNEEPFKSGFEKATKRFMKRLDDFREELEKNDT